MSPFQVMFGRTPPSIPQYIPGTSNLEAVDQELQTREAIFEQLQKKLHKAQVAMKEISSCINEVAFELALPPTAKIHPVFHVSKFKPCKGIDTPTLSLPPLSKDNQPLIEPAAILDTRNAEDPKNTMVLVQWLGLYPEDSTWESLSQLKNDYPNFHLEDKVVLDRGRDAMNQQEGWDEGPSSDAEEEPEITIPQVRAKRNKSCGLSSLISSFQIATTSLHTINLLKTMKLLKTPYHPFFLLFSMILILLLLSIPAVQAHTNETDRLALLKFKEAIIKDPYGILSSWNDSTHFCNWSGVWCGRKHRRVTLLQIENYGLSGSISPYIGNLSFLGTIALRHNYLFGQIPREVGRLFRLQELLLRNNKLTGQVPTNLGNCSKLSLISLAINQLVGTIPTEFGSLMKLYFLHVGYNDLTGSLPSTLGNLSSLEVFGAEENNLDGVIPHGIGSLKKLSIFSIAVNKPSGKIPSSLYNISSMSKFSAIQNKLAGNLPDYIGTTMSNLHVLTLGINQLSGPIPASLSNISSLSSVDLAHNNFVGSVPTNLGNLQELSWLGLNHNNLGHNSREDWKFLNSLVNCSKLEYLSLSANNIGGVLPAAISNLSTQQLKIHSNKIYGFSSKNLIGSGSFGSAYKGTLDQEERLVAVKVLNLQKKGASKSFLAECNALKGIRHRNLVNLPIFSLMLILFGSARLLSATTQVSETKSSSIGLKVFVGYAAPEYGLEGKASKEGDVYSFGILILEMFTGKRPTDEIFIDDYNLHNYVKEALPEYLLQVADPILLEEEETGEIIQRSIVSILEIGLACSEKSPEGRMNVEAVTRQLQTDQCKMKYLERLDLSSNQFRDKPFQCLGNLSIVRVLDFTDNMLSGNFPLFIVNLNVNMKRGRTIPTFPLFQKDLKYVDLSHNMVGTFPSCLMQNNLGLKVLVLRNNSLVGSIYLSSPILDIKHLDMSTNRMSGLLPEDIGLCLPNVTYLNLSVNSFEGNIPSSIGDMRKLQSLDY
ncbi:hypothetical protein L6164_028976 [Bauhinia variegata]|uniref:Uncharacterized protein n=1 Tax=Bauhinia variegata TaxID=167791 RepID=A0ACB9L789_BAUVA|nr:hypothetical protein L6164_028976 [Bauhinia variegata]